MFRKTILFLIILPIMLLGQDEFVEKGTFYPNFFAELLDAEMYSTNTIFVVGVGGFVFLDVSNLENPTMIGRYDPGNIYKRFYNGATIPGVAAGAARWDGLYFINIAFLNNPTLMAIHQSGGRSYESVALAGSYAYAAVHTDGVEVIDISDPYNPALVRTIGNMQNAWDVEIAGNFLYVADGPGGVRIYDLSQPDNPQIIAVVNTTGYSKEVVIDGNYAYIALGASGFDIIDISNPAQPQWISNFSEIFGIVNHLAVAGDRVFLATWELVYAVDVLDPANPRNIATEDTPTRAMGIAASGNRIFVADWSNVKTYTFSDQLVSDIHIKPTVYDFGFQGIGVPISKDFRVHNLGEEDLHVSNITVNSPLFVVNPTTLSVPPGEMQAVTVTFTPNSTGNQSRRLTFYSDDPDEPTKEINIFGGAQRLSPGDSAPDFTLRDLNFNQHTLSHYRGKIVILAFFASW